MKTVITFSICMLAYGSDAMADAHSISFDNSTPSDPHISWKTAGRDIPGAEAQSTDENTVTRYGNRGYRGHHNQGCPSFK